MVACSRNWWKSLWFFLNRKLFIDNDGNGDDNDADDVDKGEFVADLDIDVVDVIEELNFVLFVVVHVDDEVVLVMVLFIGFTFVTGIDVVDDSLRFLCFDDDNEVPDSRCVDSRKESLCFCIYFDECCWLLVVSAIWIDDGTFNEVANILLII